MKVILKIILHIYHRKVAKVTEAIDLVGRRTHGLRPCTKVEPSHSLLQGSHTLRVIVHKNVQALDARFTQPKDLAVFLYGTSAKIGHPHRLVFLFDEFL